MSKPEHIEKLDLYQDSLEPFSAMDSVLSVPRWALSAGHLGAWLSTFVVLDKTIISGKHFDKLGKFVCRRVTGLLGVKVRQHGLHHLKSGAAYIFCINHVSLLDLFVVFQSIPYFHRSFQDISHFKIPIYGGCIRVFGQIPVDRKNKALNEQAVARAVEMIQGGDSFVVFPEGHRTRDGRLGPFYPGAFRLAARAGVPVVPMGLRGLRNICPAGDWRIRPGTVDVLFGEPISTTGYTLEDVQELSDRCREALNELMARGTG